jgi:hypothetical protein
MTKKLAGDGLVPARPAALGHPTHARKVTRSPTRSCASRRRSGASCRKSRRTLRSGTGEHAIARELAGAIAVA